MHHTELVHQLSLLGNFVLCKPDNRNRCHSHMLVRWRNIPQFSSWHRQNRYKLWGRVIDEACGDPFVYGTPILLVHSFLKKLAHFGFVFLLYRFFSLPCHAVRHSDTDLKTIRLSYHKPERIMWVRDVNRCKWLSHVSRTLY